MPGSTCWSTGSASAGGTGAFGPADSPVQFVDPIEGDVRPAPFTVVERRGCDLHPVDATSEAGRLLLTSFVWPFDVDRHQRLAAALAGGGDASGPRRPSRRRGDWLAERLTGRSATMC